MKILYFDIAAIMIVSILLMSLYFRKMLDGRVNKFLAWLLVVTLITTILDLWEESYTIWLLPKESNTLFRYVLYYLYFLFRNLTTPLYQLFICAITDTWHILVKNKRIKGILIIPYLLDCVVLLSNPFHHKVFYFNQNLVYTRGPLIYVLYLISFFYLVYGTAYLFKSKKSLTTDKFVALILMYPLNVLAILIQLFWAGCLIEMFMTTVSMLLITTVVQRPEETINPVFGVRSSFAYTTDMKKAFYVHKPMRIIMVKIVNYTALLGILGNDSCNLLIKKILTNLSQHSDEYLQMDLYYLENGLFVFVTDKEAPDRLRTVADQFSAVLTNVMQLGKIEIELNPCICIIRCPQDIDSCERLLSFGNSFDTYLPSGGKVNDVEDRDDRLKLQLRNDIDSILTKAIEEQRFQMYYQPIYSIEKQKFLSAEALIRLYDDTYGFISPELFITAAERNGTILQIGDYILDEVCRFIERCGKERIPLDYIEINLSMVQCMQQELVEKVQFYLNKYNLKPDQINLEITETAASTAQDIVEDNIQKLSKQGISFSLDDYGTGYSNISRIISLPFHIVKLDKGLTDKVEDPKMKTLLKNTICMLKEIGMEIVVEGVETQETLEQFVNLKCDFIQGFYFSKPLPEQEFVEFILKSGSLACNHQKL